MAGGIPKVRIRKAVTNVVTPSKATAFGTDYKVGKTVGKAGKAG